MTTDSVYIIVEELESALTKDTPPDDINELLEKCSLVLLGYSTAPLDFTNLLVGLKAVIENESQKFETIIDWETLFELLNRLISLSDFEILIKVYSIDDFGKALRSQSDLLKQIAAKIIGKSHPKDILASSTILDELLRAFFDPNVDTRVVNEIENTLRVLCSTEMVRKRILNDNFGLLLEIRQNLADTKLVSRLSVIMTMLCEYITPNEFRESLFVFKPEEVLQSIGKDIMLFITILIYYKDVLKIIIDSQRSSASSSKYLIKYYQETFVAFGTIYRDIDKYSEVQDTGLPYLFSLLKEISYLDDSAYFRQLDDCHLKIGSDKNAEYAIDFFSFVNPQYLMDYHMNLLDNMIVIEPTYLAVLRNIIGNRMCFEKFSDHFGSSDILGMPYLEQMALLEKMSQYDYSTKFLITNLPKVMGSLVYHGKEVITEPETVALRSEVLSNLLNFNSELLDVWYLPIKKELGQGIKNDEALTEVADTYL